MKLNRRDFLRASAIAAAAAAAGITRPEMLFAANAVRSFPVGQCRYCAVGCTMIADCEVDAAGKVTRVIALKGDLKSTVNRGVLCTKGFYLHKALMYKDRPKGALIRKEWINPKTGKPDLVNSPRVLEGKTTKEPKGIKPSETDLKENFILVPWEDAINFVADAVEKTVKENGKHSVAYYGSGQLGTEETHIMNKSLKGGGMIANNAVEGQPRTCMASAVVGYLYTFGKDEPYGSLDDLDVPDPDFGKHADTFFLIGSNTAEAHPILFNRIAALKAKNPDKYKVILADPRKTRSGTIADLWLPFATGRDIILINAMAYVITHELDGAKYDVEKGSVDAKWKYLDKKFIERHVSFGIHEDVKKTWIKTVYGGTRDTAWDLTYTPEPRKTYPNLKNKYNSEDDIKKDLYKGFAVFLKFLEDYNPDKVADAIFEGESPLVYDRATRTWKKISGAEAIRLAAKWYAEGYTTSIWCMGVNQKLQGTWTNASLHMLNLITGSTVKPGRHSFSFTGQPNACGGIRAPGALCHALPYGRLVANPVHRGQVEGIWKKRAEAYLKKKGMSDSAIKAETDKIKIHDKPGPHTIEMFRRLGAGQIKVQFMSTVNAGQSLPYSWPYRLACAAANKGQAWPIIVTLEAFPNATTMVSDVVLGASSWYEKEFIFGNLERRYQVIKQVIEPYGNTIPDHTIFALIMRRLEEKGLVPKGHVSQFWPEKYDGSDWMKKTIDAAKTKEWNREFSSNIWEELMQLSDGTGYDFSGMNRKMLLEQNHGYRIPLPKEYHTNADVKKRYDRYVSRIQYAYPYDPHIDGKTNFYLKNMKEFNPVYGAWLDKNINDMKADEDYHKKENLPKGWYASFYNSNAFINGMVDIKTPDGKTRKAPGWDGRAVAWANPWWACKFDGKEFVKAKTVEVIERKFNPAKVNENSTLPFDVTGKYTVNVIGDPNKDMNALKNIALSPAEFANLKHEYTKADGSKLLIIDTTQYKYGACTGRVVEHWHTGSMTTRVAELNRAVPGAYVELNEILAKKLGIKNGDSVIVESPRGKIELPAKVLDVAKATGGPRHDYVFVPWFDEYKLINMIMRDAFDPFSFQPDYKMFAVKIYKGKTKGRQAEPGKVIA
ncbi:MAG: molybdopterin oxidoreductase family protein [Nitrospirae bacterium]|nr:molybdopterin oxidoreductase family protein [Nitrospirota bacterium]MCL5976642.1 molybdopterin oxidoreductase family protein [Nitrospirota bacterium]